MSLQHLISPCVVKYISVLEHIMSRLRKYWQVLLLGLVSGALFVAVLLQDLGWRAIDQAQHKGNINPFFSPLDSKHRLDETVIQADSALAKGAGAAHGSSVSSSGKDGKRLPFQAPDDFREKSGRKKGLGELLILQQARNVAASRPRSRGDGGKAPYHDWKFFQLHYQEMTRRLKIYVYPDAFDTKAAFSHVFTPHPNPYDKRLGNYFSEHMFKLLLLNSTFMTTDPAEASLFFLPFSINVLRNDARVRTEPAIANFVAAYVEEVRQKYPFWNRSEGADHFYVCCHSVCRDAMAQAPVLRRNSIQATCSSNFYSKNFIAHKDVALPQVYSGRPSQLPSSPLLRTRLAFFAGRQQNSPVRKRLTELWGTDPDMDIYEGPVQGTYIEHFLRSKFCLHVRGYEVNTARVSDAIYFGCVPVILSNYYDLPLSGVLDWSQLAVVLNHRDLHLLKPALRAVSDRRYARLAANVRSVQRHFLWENPPQQYDAFHMTLHQLWVRALVNVDTNMWRINSTLGYP